MKKTKLLVITSLSVALLLSFITTSKIISQSDNQEFIMTEIAQIDTGGLAFDIEVVENTAYIADGVGGLVLIDVSDPNNPQKISSFNDAVGELCIVDSLVYVADNNDGLEIIDISNSSNPTEVGSFNDGGQALGVAVNGDYAFVADGQDGLEILDISNPSNPIEVAQYYIPGSSNNIILVDDLALVTECTIVDGEPQSSSLKILNISDIDNIVEIGSYIPANLNTIHFLDVSGNSVYLSVHGSQMSLRIMDFNSGKNPTEIGRYYCGSGGAPNKMSVINDLIYIACGNVGLKVVDVSSLTHPVEIDTYYDGGHAYDVKVVGNFAYVADRTDGLEIIQISDITDNTSNSTIPGFGFIEFILGIITFCSLIKMIHRDSPLIELDGKNVSNYDL